MLLRKINAVIGCLITFLLLGHAIFLSVWMLSRCSIAKPVNPLSWILLGLTVIHAIISVWFGVSSHKGTEKQKNKSYPKKNIPTIIQRATGIIIFLVIGFHILGASTHFQPKMLHAVIHPIFFLAALAHVSVSASKALITLGIGNAKVIKVVDIVVRLICIATFVAGVIGFYLCLFVGVAR